MCVTLDTELKCIRCTRVHVHARARDVRHVCDARVPDRREVAHQVRQQAWPPPRRIEVRRQGRSLGPQRWRPARVWHRALYTGGAHGVGRDTDGVGRDTGRQVPVSLLTVAWSMLRVA